jgi:hypothetical protein
MSEENKEVTVTDIFPNYNRFDNVDFGLFV